jgi:mRNA-degrading endonuclease toxin of MazEF toxin-antitoxin module
MSSSRSAQRGEVWLANLDPSFGHEQGGRRPVVVVSVDSFNAGLSGLVVVLPITSRRRSLPLHIVVNPPEGGLRGPSAILCDAVRLQKIVSADCWAFEQGSKVLRNNRGSANKTATTNTRTACPPEATSRKTP